MYEGIVRKIESLKEIISRNINVTNSFIKTLIDINTFKAQDSMYNDLAPTDVAQNLNNYTEILDWSLKNDRVKNVAITGMYGSGKSSILHTYFTSINKHMYNPIFISLATFNKNDDICYDEAGEKTAKEAQNKHIVQSLERSILQQLLYHVDERKAPLSRFKRLTKHSKRDILLISISLIFIIEFLVILIFPNVIEIIQHNYITAITTLNISESISSLLPYIFMGLAIITVYNTVYLVKTRFNIASVKFKSTEIELNQKNDSIFNKYLDEILYFFQVTNHSVIIFEDLDRFDNVSAIFTKLRELNQLINNSSQVRKKIVFVFAVKDEYFINEEERTKFFDVIVPVIPTTSKYNSNEVIWSMLEKSKSKTNVNLFSLNKEFITDIASFLHDRRVINNIINEFVLFKNGFVGKELDDRKLFSMIAYKNIFPMKYAELQKDKGYIVELFNNKLNYIDEIIGDLKVNVSEKTKEITAIKNEKLNSVKELKSIVIATIHSRRQFSNVRVIYGSVDVSSSEFLNSDLDLEMLLDNSLRINLGYGTPLDETEAFSLVGGKEEFINRYRILSDDKYEKINNLERDIAKDKKMIELIKEKSMREIINEHEDILSRYFSSEQFENFLLRKGYIDETYSDYIAVFIEGDLSNNDNNFIISVKNRKSKNYNFQLTNLEEIIRRLEASEFSRISILNNYLFKYLIETSNDQLLDKMASMFNKFSDVEIEFLNQFRKFYDNQDYYDFLIDKVPGFFEEIIKNSEYGDDRIEWLRVMLINPNATNSDVQESVKYLSELNKIDELFDGLDVEQVVSTLNKLNVKFENLDFEMLGDALYLIVYENNIYKLDLNMISNILKRNGIESDSFQSASYTTILESGMDSLIKNVYNNIDEFIENCYLHCENDKEKNENVIELLINNEIKLDNKKSILKNSEVYVKEIGEFDNLLYTSILSNSKLEPTWDNVYCLLAFYEDVTQDIIKFIDINIDKLVVANFKNNKFINELLVSKEINVDVKVKVIIQMIENRVDVRESLSNMGDPFNKIHDYTIPNVSLTLNALNVQLAARLTEVNLIASYTEKKNVVMLYNKRTTNKV